MWIPVHTAKASGQRSHFVSLESWRPGQKETDWVHAVSNIQQTRIWTCNVNHHLCCLVSMGQALSPFHYTWEVWRWRHKLGRTSQLRLRELCHWHAGSLWDTGVMSVWEKVTWVSSCLMMSLSALLWFVYSLYISCKMKMRPSVWRQLEGKDSAWKSMTRVAIMASELLWDTLLYPRGLQCG